MLSKWSNSLRTWLYASQRLELDHKMVTIRIYVLPVAQDVEINILKCLFFWIKLSRPQWRRAGVTYYLYFYVWMIFIVGTRLIVVLDNGLRAFLYLLFYHTKDVCYWITLHKKGSVEKLSAWRSRIRYICWPCVLLE